MNIDERVFSGVDLNLLLVFMVIYREKNLSKAAQCLDVRQPAVSGSLSRLRLRFNDTLFLSEGSKGVRPTQRANELAEVLLPALSTIQMLIKAGLR
jgi:DNA-binding transcriptional LysR family regulator